MLVRQNGFAIGPFVLLFGVLAAAGFAAIQYQMAVDQVNWISRESAQLVDQANKIHDRVISCGQTYPSGVNADASSPAALKRFPGSSLRLADASCPGAPAPMSAIWSGRDGSFLTVLPSDFGAWTYSNDAQGLRASLTSTTSRGTEAASKAVSKLNGMAAMSGPNLNLTIATYAQAVAVPGASASSPAATNDGTLVWDRSSYDFGVQQLNQSTMMNVVLRNQSNAPSGSIAYSAPAGYTVSGCSSVPAGGSCGVQLTFKPSTGTSYAGNVLATTSRAQATMAVSGSGFVGTVSLQWDRQSYDFNNTSKNQTKSMNVVLRNSGTAPTGAISYAVSDRFSASGCESGVPAGGSCGVVISFTPLEKGVFSGTVVAASSRSSTTLNVAGTGR